MKPEENLHNKKILFFIQLPPPVHGVSKMNQLIINNELLIENFTIDIVEIKFSNSLSGLRKINFNKVFRFIKVYWALYRKLQDYSPDLVYFSFMPIGIGFFRDFIYLKLIKKFKPKIILHLHNKGIRQKSENLIYQKLYQSAFQDLSIVHVSEKLKMEEFSQLSALNCYHYVINNTCAPLQLQKRVNNDQLINILFISNIFPEKGVEIAINAVLKASRKHSNIRLHIYGFAMRENYERKIRNRVSLNNLSEMIIMHGPANNVLKCKALSQADIFIFSSYFKEECMPLSLLEAMQSRLPIIASKIGAIPELIEDGINGILVSPENVDELSEKINLLIENDAFKNKIGIAAGITFQKKYSYEDFMKKHLEIILDVLSK